MKKIKAVEIRTVCYTPNYSEDFYQEHNVTTLEEAIRIDLSDLKNGAVEIGNLGDGLPEIEYRLEIVEVPDDDSTDSA